MIAAVSVLNLSAKTPNYGMLYKGQEPRSAYMTAQMPTAAMGSVNVGYVESGTTLPLAVQTGVVTTYDGDIEVPPRSISTPRKRPGDNADPMPDPLGDGLLPLMLLAVAMAGVIALRRRKKEEKAVSQTAQ